MSVDRQQSSALFRLALQYFERALVVGGRHAYELIRFVPRDERIRRTVFASVGRCDIFVYGDLYFFVLPAVGEFTVFVNRNVFHHKRVHSPAAVIAVYTGHIRYKTAAALRKRIFKQRQELAVRQLIAVNEIAERKNVVNVRGGYDAPPSRDVERNAHAAAVHKADIGSRGAGDYRRHPVSRGVGAVAAATYQIVFRHRFGYISYLTVHGERYEIGIDIRKRDYIGVELLSSAVFIKHFVFRGGQRLHGSDSFEDRLVFRVRLERELGVGVSLTVRGGLNVIQAVCPARNVSVRVTAKNEIDRRIAAEPPRRFLRFAVDEEQSRVAQSLFLKLAREAVHRRVILVYFIPLAGESRVKYARRIIRQKAYYGDTHAQIRLAVRGGFFKYHVIARKTDFFAVLIEIRGDERYQVFVLHAV